jgi:thiamine biosynthesis protein ThiS
MTLHLNGEPREFPDGLTVAALVSQQGMKPDRVAVELNLEIVPRARWEVTMLKDGDKLEIVHFVGGGSSGKVAERKSRIIQEAHNSQEWTCPACGAKTEHKFCGNCGEKKFSPADLSVRHFFSHALEEFFHFDSKVFATFRLLFAKPGFLSTAYARGCRKPYLHPFQVFFIANLLYFFLQPLTGWSGLKTPLYVHTHMSVYGPLATRLIARRVASQGISEAQLTARFNHVVDLQARSLVLVMVPMFALVLWALEWQKRRFFGEHLAFALHFYAFWILTMFLILFGLTTPVLVFLRHQGIVFGERALDRFLYLAGQGITLVYLFLAIRVFYRDSSAFALAKALAMIFAMYYILQLYRFILFLTALHTS